MKCKLFDIVFMPFLCIYVNTFLFFIAQDPQVCLEYIRIIAGAAAYRFTVPEASCGRRRFHRP